MGKSSRVLSPLCPPSFLSPPQPDRAQSSPNVPQHSLLGKDPENRGICLEHSILKTPSERERRRRHLGRVTESPTQGIASTMMMTEQLQQSPTLESSRWATKVAKALHTLHCSSAHRSSETTWMPTWRGRVTQEEGGREASGSRLQLGEAEEPPGWISGAPASPTRHGTPGTKTCF